MQITTARDNIARIIQDQDAFIGRQHAEEYATAITAEGYAKPRNITSVAELDALRAGSVVVMLDVLGATVSTWSRDYNGLWICAGIEERFASSAIDLDTWDARVLLEGA